MQTSFDPEKTWKAFYEQQSTGSSRCYVIKLSDKKPPPDQKKLSQLPFPYNSAYVRHQQKLYYINQTNQLCEEIKVSDPRLADFDKLLRPHPVAKPIHKEQLKIIVPLIDHKPPSEERRLEWYKLRLTEKRHQKFKKALSLSGKMSSARLTELLDLQKKWKQKKKSSVNPRGNHSEEFDELVHGQTIQKSIDLKKLEQLETALNGGDSVDWGDPIFKDEELAELALTLLGQEKTDFKKPKTMLWQKTKITIHQAVTILERVQTLKDYQHRDTYSILDEKGEFTSYAREVLLPALNRFQRLADEEIEQFRLLVSKLPRSEQMFYEIDGSKYDLRTLLYWHTLDSFGSLGEFLIYAGIVPCNLFSKNLFVLSAGLRDALGLVRFKENYVPMRATLGTKMPLEIEDGLRWPRKKRFGALNYKGTKPYTEVHGEVRRGTLTPFVATLHDVYHSFVVSSLPIDFQNIILYLVDILRESIAEDIASNLTAEIWSLIDCEINYFLRLADPRIAKRAQNNQLTPEEMTEQFCNLLLLSPTIKNIFAYQRPHFLIWKKNYLGLSGAMFLLNFIKNKKNWERFKIDLDLLPRDNFIYQYYQEIKKIYKWMEKDPPKIQLVKIYLYQFLKLKSVDERQFKMISELMSSHQALMLKNFKLNKISKAFIDKNPSYVYLENRLHLSYRGEYSNYLKLLLEDLARAEGYKNPNDFSHCILSLHYTPDEIQRYMAQKERQQTNREAEYIAKPSVWTWIKCHKLLSLLVLPIFYGWYQTVQLNKSYAAHLSEKTYDIKHIEIPVTQEPTESASMDPAPAGPSASSEKGPLSESEVRAQGSNEPRFASLDIPQQTTTSASPMSTKRL